MRCPRARIDRKGERIGHQTCLGDSGIRRGRSVLWLWLCDCGTTFKREYQDALKTRTCGQCHYWRRGMSESARARGTMIRGRLWTPVVAALPAQNTPVRVRNGVREWETRWKPGLLAMADYGIAPVTHWRPK